VHSHSKRIFTHIRAKVSGRGACTQRTFHKLYILPKARISASVLHIQRFHAYSRIFTHTPHVHTHTRHLAHIRTEARIFTRKLPQMATFPSLLTQQNDLVKFARKNSQKPSLLEQQFGLGQICTQKQPNPEPVHTAKYLAVFRTRRNTRQKPSLLIQQKYLAHFSKRSAPNAILLI
jgi:hypothetical protein